MSSRSLAFLGMLLSSFAFASSSQATFLLGNIKGTLLAKSDDGKINQTHVNGASSDDNGNHDYKINLSVSGKDASVEVNFSDDSDFHISSSFSKLDGSDLSQEDDGVCFLGSIGEADSIRVCPDEQKVSFERSNDSGDVIFSLTLEKVEAASPVAISPKPILTLDEAISMAKSQSFTSRIQYEQLLQTKQQSKQAHLDLLPHITLNSVVAVASSFTVVGLITGLSDLAPFLFPDRWAKAKAASALARAQTYASQMMQIETISQIEEFSILNWQENQSIQYGIMMSDKMNKLLSTVGEMESIGAYPSGTYDGLKVSSIALKEDLLTYQEMKSATLRGIGSTLAYPVVDDLKEVNIDSIKLNFDELPAYDRATVEAQVLNQSVAAKQMDALIQAAQSEKVATSFSWLDVTVGISAGHWSSVAVSKAKVAELQVRKEQLANQTKQLVADTLGQWELAKSAYALANEKLVFQKKRLEKTLFLYQFGKDIGALELINAIQEENKSELDVLNAQATLMVADSRVRKLTLGKNYTL